MARIRDFDPSALDAYRSVRLQVAGGMNTGFEGSSRQFSVFLPRWFIATAQRERILLASDIDALRSILVRDFGGCTVNASPLEGIGRRGLEFETNLHTQVVVLASRWRGTMRYFRALRRELEACSGEEQVLILRQDLIII